MVQPSEKLATTTFTAGAIDAAIEMIGPPPPIGLFPSHPWYRKAIDEMGARVDDDGIAWLTTG